MLCHIGTHFQAEVKTTGIHIELSSLEHCRDVLVVEINHCHIVAQQRVEITVEMQQAFQRFDNVVLVGEFLLMAFVYVLCFLILGGNVIVYLGNHGVPLILSKGVFAGIVNIQNQFLNLGKLALPSRVDAFFDGQQSIGTGFAERILRYFLNIRGKILFAYFCHLLSRHVQSSSAVVMELDKLATEEIVCYFVADNIDSRHSIVAVSAIGTTLHRETLKRRFKVFRAILIIICKNLIQLGKGDGRLFQTHNLQNLSSAIMHLGTLLVVRIEISQVNIVVTLKNHVLVLHNRAEPIGSCDDLFGTYLSIAVKINQIKGTLIQFKTLDRATQNRPQLLIQLCQMSNIISTGNTHTLGTAQ